ncbi:MULTISPECIES: IclR family transcriptional regulator [unclassified Cupriavidus]|uniref:IclR family transcriptional regulator n=3 Tax=Cupriavidus TaxID=106589 RepID=UPI001C0033C9|nr:MULTISPECIES: IclR family transcriptional regulator [unclassified Cupriavidus]MCA3186373.1 IclR family transcriptional regulator [Cupriavidus sp.]MCA3189290.1 IclR family transcriptional regulator [Cupriavidus sp.]MCA3195370.1 IclR family transcriptional regulator [Cupriavidus sp.]MCA3200925.1 IclR family transcriptional regulator [Cupriavidus sp.]MCA3235148.1 IclR family transcriptional regulator [Cupriavidus sp.]
MPAPKSPLHHPDPAFATTLAHGLALLQCFRVGETVLSNKELAERTGLSKATISRLTYTLAVRGLLLYDSRLRRYRLGSTALSLGYPLLASLRVRQVARPLMKALADRMGGSVSLGLRDRLRMVYVETSRGHDAIAFRPDIGASLPMLASAIGRAWLAQAPADLRAAVLDGLRDAEPDDWHRHADAIPAAIADLATLGFTRSAGDWLPDVHAVAVPMRHPIDGETLVFNCGVPAARMTPGKLEREMGPRLIELVAEVEALLA